MTVYAIAQLRFTDRSAYDRYQNRFLGVFAKYAGTILAADEAPVQEFRACETPASFVARRTR